VANQVDHFPVETVLVVKTDAEEHGLPSPQLRAGEHPEHGAGPLGVVASPHALLIRRAPHLRRAHPRLVRSQARFQIVFGPATQHVVSVPLRGYVLVHGVVESLELPPRFAVLTVHLLRHVHPVGLVEVAEVCVFEAKCGTRGYQ